MLLVFVIAKSQTNPLMQFKFNLRKVTDHGTFDLSHGQRPMLPKTWCLGNKFPLITFVFNYESPVVT
jgi:hypothetical protein